MNALRLIAVLLLLITAPAAHAAEVAPPADVIVAADGSGDFKTIQAALESIPSDNRERTVVLVRIGVYQEKIRVDADFVTLRGESRDDTRIEFAQLADDFNANRDRLGRAVVNVNGDDFVMENLTATNTADVVGLHAFTMYGSPDRTVVVDCNVLSTGADTMSLWNGGEGRYYHARCRMRGAVDFLCPRGWCYTTDCQFEGTKPSAVMWHDGSKNRDEKFVLRNCTFDGVPGYELARHHHDAAFYFLSCQFSESMKDRAPYRVIYPLGSAAATEEDLRRNRELEATNRWGDRVYFHDCHRTGGDYPWHADNLGDATEGLTPDKITAAWTFAGAWDPEAAAGPRIVEVTRADGKATLKFSEPVTVKGKPALVFAIPERGVYESGSGTDELVFTLPDGAGDISSVDPAGGFILASRASAKLRGAELTLPAADQDAAEAAP